MVFSVISSFCSSPCALTPLLAKAVVSTEKNQFVVVLITSFLPFATTQRGPSSLLWLPAMLWSVNTLLGHEQGGRLKSTHKSEHALWSSFCLNGVGCYFVLFQGSLHRVKMPTDFLREKSVLVTVCNQLHYSLASSLHNPSNLHPTTTLQIYQRKSPAFLKIQCSTLQKTNSTYRTFKN